MHRLIGRIPRQVRHARRSDDDLTRSCGPLIASDAKGRGTGDDLPALLHLGMDVLGVRCPGRVQKSSISRSRPVGVGRGLQEHDPLARDRVDQLVSRACHQLDLGRRILSTLSQSTSSSHPTRRCSIWSSLRGHCPMAVRVIAAWRGCCASAAAPAPPSTCSSPSSCPSASRHRTADRPSRLPTGSHSRPGAVRRQGRRGRSRGWARRCAPLSHDLVEGRRINMDATFPGPPWDGRSSLPLACGPGRDYPPARIPTPISARLRPSTATRRSVSRSSRRWRP